MVTIEDEVAGLVPKIPVIPGGQADAARVTPELKPYKGLTVTVDVPVDPADTVAPVAFKAKLGCAVTVSEMTVVAERLPLVPLTVSA
jgi:hypothetical protein